ncbi:MAG: exo-alpha-sialidase [bacterium]|nr:exo-alpha-sialidase [bacterium]
MTYWLILLGSVSMTMTAADGQREDTTTQAIPVIGSESVVYESPYAPKVYAYSPGIVRLASGRLVATMDQGVRDPSKVADLRIDEGGRKWTGKIYTSDDHGKTWTQRSDMPLYHARPFVAGDAVYVLGHAGDLGVMRSTDGGDTWEGAFWLTEDEHWHQAPCSVWHTRGRVYLVMEKNTDPSFKGWAVAVLAPVVMAGDEGADLTKRESWTFSNELSYRSAVEKAGDPHLVGVPFYKPGRTAPDNPKDKRSMAPPGWLETNIVQFTDPDHLWFDPAGRTFHLWMRAHTGSTNLACIAKAVEAEDGSIEVSLETAPSGEPMLYVPCPGGQMKFHILYDEETKLFWLLSTQATDSMTRPELLPDNRFNLPNNERHRLVLHFSKNCVDWCFAARVADSGNYGQGRHYASMVIDDDDLHVLSRSGDDRAKSAHDGNLITFHTVKDFRALVY